MASKHKSLLVVPVRAREAAGCEEASGRGKDTFIDNDQEKGGKRCQESRQGEETHLLHYHTLNLHRNLHITCRKVESIPAVGPESRQRCSRDGACLFFDNFHDFDRHLRHNHLLNFANNLSARRLAQALAAAAPGRGAAQEGSDLLDDDTVDVDRDVDLHDALNNNRARHLGYHDALHLNRYLVAHHALDRHFHGRLLDHHLISLLTAIRRNGRNGARPQG